MSLLGIDPERAGKEATNRRSTAQLLRPLGHRLPGTPRAEVDRRRDNSRGRILRGRILSGRPGLPAVAFDLGWRGGAVLRRPSAVGGRDVQPVLAVPAPTRARALDQAEQGSGRSLPGKLRQLVGVAITSYGVSRYSASSTVTTRRLSPGERNGVNGQSPSGSEQNTSTSRRARSASSLQGGLPVPEQPVPNSQLPPFAPTLLHPPAPRSRYRVKRRIAVGLLGLFVLNAVVASVIATRNARKDEATALGASLPEGLEHHTHYRSEQENPPPFA
jgi:hypothetical protein